MSYYEDTHDLFQRDIIEEPAGEHPRETTRMAKVNGLDTQTQESDR